MFQWFQFCCVRFFHAQRFGPAPHNCAAEWKSPQLDASGSCGFIFPSNPSLQLVSLYCPLNKLCLPPIVRPATSHTPDLAKHLAPNRSWGLRPSSLHLQYTAENWLSATKQLNIRAWWMSGLNYVGPLKRAESGRMRKITSICHNWDRQGGGQTGKRQRQCLRTPTDTQTRRVLWTLLI